MTAPELARVLGHKSAAFTVNRYVHFFERAERRKALTFAQLTGSANLKGVIVGGIGSESTGTGSSEKRRIPVWDGGLGWWAAQDLNL